MSKIFQKTIKKFKLGVPTELHKYWISENLFDRICSEIAELVQRPFEVELVVTGKKSPGRSRESRGPPSGHDHE